RRGPRAAGRGARPADPRRVRARGARGRPVSDLLDVFRLDGRVAAITGAASGIGRAVAHVLAAAGAHVVLGDLDEAAARAAAREIEDRGGTARARRVDVAVRADPDAPVALALGGLSPPHPRA